MAGDLTANFSLSELVRSQLATRRGIVMVPDAIVKANLRRLAVHVLQPVRDHFGVPVLVESGYRSQELERALKGMSVGWISSSQHTLGEAADFEVAGVSNLAVARWIAANLDFDQLILEFYDGTPSSGWVHCSYREVRLRKQVLTASRKNGRVVYTPGLPKGDA